MPSPGPVVGMEKCYGNEESEVSSLILEAIAIIPFMRKEDQDIMN